MKKLRVIAKHSGDDVYDVTQFLQEEKKYLFWEAWKTIDFEKIPRACLMQHYILGSTSWRSKFRDVKNVRFCKLVNGKWV
tara:strand:- start:208 stop:447 length:240 start_codon:yes stop_codon:yes gene_type:complete